MENPYESVIGIEDTNVHLIDHPSSFAVRFWNRDDVKKTEPMDEELIESAEERLAKLYKKNQHDKSIDNENIDNKLNDNDVKDDVIRDIIIKDRVIKEIEKRLGFVYKYEKSTKMPTVLTVTELKRKFNVEITEGESQQYVFSKTYK